MHVHSSQLFYLAYQLYMSIYKYEATGKQPFCQSSRLVTLRMCKQVVDSFSHRFRCSGDVQAQMRCRLGEFIQVDEANPCLHQGLPVDKPYLCTGFDCYVVGEPCVMCSMAMVHARVRRVVYTLSQPVGGALGGSVFLHEQKGLNHRYTVYSFDSTRQH